MWKTPSLIFVLVLGVGASSGEEWYGRRLDMCNAGRLPQQGQQLNVHVNDARNGAQRTEREPFLPHMGV
jgi:hypothetical protein